MHQVSSNRHCQPVIIVATKAIATELNGTACTCATSKPKCNTRKYNIYSLRSTTSKVNARSTTLSCIPTTLLGKCLNSERRCMRYVHVHRSTKQLYVQWMVQCAVGVLRQLRSLRALMKAYWRLHFVKLAPASWVTRCGSFVVLPWGGRGGVLDLYVGRGRSAASRENAQCPSSLVANV